MFLFFQTEVELFNFLTDSILSNSIDRATPEENTRIIKGAWFPTALYC
jgi:hypothetical protein